MATDGINKPKNQRPNYFAGQYLLEDDFQLEQQYHIDRQRWHHHLLHISGIAEGLKVEKIENALAVKISEGSAIDPQGQQIILLNPQQIDLTKIITNSTISDGIYTLYIGAKPKLTEQQTAGIDTSSRRWQEDPDFQLTATSSELKDYVPLAKLTIKSNLVSEIDNSIRTYSGLRLPTIDGEITLRSKSDGIKSQAELNSSLSIVGTLSVTGNVGIGTINPSEKLEVSGNIKATGNLSITGNANIKGTSKDNKAAGLNVTNSDSNSLLYVRNDGNIGIGTTNPGVKLEISGGDLKVSGSIVPSTGNTEKFGIMFPKNPGTGSDDAAWIRYYPRSGEACTLEIGISNDSDDHIAFMAGGNVGIGTTIPTEKLEISGGNLKVSGNIFASNATLSGNIRIGTGSIVATSKKLEIESGEFRVKASHNNETADIGAFYTNNLSQGIGIGYNRIEAIGSNTNQDILIRPKGSGNVGIGTTTPTAKLDISGAADTVSQISLQLRSGNSNANYNSNQIVLGYNNTDQYRHAIKTRHNGGARSGNAIDFFVWKFINANNKDNLGDIGSLHTMTLEGGNVGIGTTDPGTSKLKVANSTSDFTDISFNGSGMGQLQFIGWQSGWNINTMTAGKNLYLNRDTGDTSNVLIGRNGKELFVRGSDGNVGIGTTNPGTKLAISASANHLQLRRENTETTGDKLLFLELYQDDPRLPANQNNPIVPEVWPSIRFHHANRYWHRMEARSDGFHLKTGDLAKDDYRNIYAANIASCPETLNMIRGTVETNGSILAGTGFTVTRNNTGTYTITFSTAFSSVPTVVATQQYPANNDFSDVTQSTLDNAVVVGVSTIKCQIKCGNGAGNLTDRRFHFIAIGTR